MYILDELDVFTLVIVELLLIFNREDSIIANLLMVFQHEDILNTGIL